MLQKYITAGPELLGNHRDRVPYARFVSNPAPASLTMVEPSEVAWVIDESYSGKRQTRTKFQLDDRVYNLPITDPAWERRLSELPRGVHSGVHDRLLFTVSLGEPYYGNNTDGECSKLVAAVIVLPG